MSAISADYEDLLLGKPDQLDTRAADLVTAADAIEQHPRRRDPHLASGQPHDGHRSRAQRRERQ